MPYDNFNMFYECVASGINAQGDRYSTRDYGPNARIRYCYYYTSSDGSYYYANPDGSTYFKDKKGNATYTPPLSGSTKAMAEYQGVAREVETTLLSVVDMLRDDDTVLSRRRLIQTLADAAESLGRLGVDAGKTKDAAGSPRAASPPDGAESGGTKGNGEVESLLGRLGVDAGKSKGTAGSPRTASPPDGAEGRDRRLIQILTDAAESLGRLGVDAGKNKGAAGSPRAASPPDGAEGRASRINSEVESLLALLNVGDADKDAGERSNAQPTNTWSAGLPRPTNATV